MTENIEDRGRGKEGSVHSLSSAARKVIISNMFGLFVSLRLFWSIFDVLLLLLMLYQRWNNRALTMPRLGA